MDRAHSNMDRGGELTETWVDLRRELTQTLTQLTLTWTEVGQLTETWVEVKVYVNEPSTPT
jgi:head-tail adaptor